MREMIDSGIEWVGMIPSTWDTISNKYIMRKQKRICSTWNGEDVLSLTVNGVIVRDLENPTGKMPATFDGYQYAYENELLMCLFDIDVTPRCVGRVRNNGVTSPAYSCFVLNDGYDVNYFYYYYLMVDHTKELLHLAKNLRHSFTEEQLGVLQVPVPSAEEQHKIAGFLDRECGEIDSVLARTRASVDEYKRLKQSLVSQIVLSGIRGNRELKESGIDWVGQIPKDWKVLKNGQSYHRAYYAAEQEPIYCMAENAWGRCLAECAGEVSAYPWQFDPYRLQQRIGRQTFRCETERIRRC